ncbi:MAG: hypothetical protein ABL958_17320 [Bdellovibrionia bacterium]
MEKVKMSKDGKSIAYVAQEQLPASPKKFRQSPELEGFYRFLHENDLRKEALEVIDRLNFDRKAKRSAERAALKKSKATN